MTLEGFCKVSAVERWRYGNTELNVLERGTYSVSRRAATRLRWHSTEIHRLLLPETTLKRCDPRGLLHRFDQDERQPRFPNEGLP